MITRMRWMRGAFLITALVGLLSAPSVADAVVLTPPGRAGTNQYYEDVPSARGPAAPPQGASAGPSTGNAERTIAAVGHARQGIARLNRMGKAGRAAAALAASSAAATLTPRGPQAGRAGALSAGAVPAPHGSTLKGLADALGGGSGGLGVLLPVLLAAIVLVALLLALIRSRGRSEPAT